MSYAILEKEIETLPQSAVSEVVDFVRFIKSKLSKAESTSAKKSMYGVWKGEPYYMAQDFDEPLDDFEEYM
jgi:hypothetical protein